MVVKKKKDKKEELKCECFDCGDSFNKAELRPKHYDRNLLVCEKQIEMRIMNRTFSNNKRWFINCSDIPNPSDFYKKEVTIREKISNIEFKAFVVDYCIESDKKGIIVSIPTNIAKTLTNQDVLLPAENDNYNELDLTSMFHGHLFEFIVFYH